MEILKDLSVEKDVDKYENEWNDITGSLFEFVDFMKGRNYCIQSDFFDIFFKLITKIDLQNLTFVDLEPFLKSIIVKNLEESDSFEFDFNDFIKHRKKPEAKTEVNFFIKNKKELKNVIRISKQKIENYEQEIYSETKKIEKIKQEINRDKDNDPLDKEKKAFDNLVKKTKGEFNQLIELIENENIKNGINNLYSNDKTFSVNELNSIENELSQMSMNAMDFNNYEEIFKCIKKIEKRINQIKEKIDSKKQKELIDRQNKVDKLNKEKENVQYLLDKKMESMALNNSKLIKKAESIISRNEFMSAGNSVKSISIGYNKEFYKDFNELTNEEKQKIKKYIRENARQFRTRISRNIKTDNKRKIDLPETCKKACSTNGIPINLCYKKPVRQKTRLVMFLDISGSCKEASEMMLYFMYCMKEVFPGGCKVYVFVNKLYDISKYFEIKDPDLAIKEVLSTIPTRGVYSDYGTPFKEFYENHFQELTNDSFVFFIGDARNNKNDSGEKYIKEISRRCRKAYWFNTEEKLKWNTNDSIIDKYKPYMDSVDEILTTENLLTTLSNIK